MNPLLSIHLAVLLFGAAGLFGRVLTLPPTLIVLGRVVFASAALWVVLSLRRRRRPADPPLRNPGGERARESGDLDTPPPPRAWVAHALLGLLLAIHWVTFFHAIQLSSVAVGLLTFATFPVFTALLEPLLPGERFDRNTLVMALVTVAGVALVVPSPSPTDPVTRGAFWGVVSGLTFALLSLANRNWVRRESALVLAFHQDLWAAVFLIPFAFTAPRAPTADEWGLLVLLGVVFTAGAHGLFIRGLRGVTAGRASVLASLEPVYGVALAWEFLGERPEARTLVGGAVVLAAAAWTSWRGAESTPSVRAGEG